MTALPIVQVVRPSDLLGVTNGQLDPSLLVTIGPRGQLHHLAARAWRALVAAATADGVPLTYSYGGTYRTLADQATLFRQRYTLNLLVGRPTKLWNGQLWYQLPNTAMAAVPGTSNHGLGLAVDTATDSDWSDGLGPDDAVSIAPHLGWLAANAPRFGWSWENTEIWHIRYVVGDRIPDAVAAFEKATNPRPAPTPAPPPDEHEDDDDMYQLIRFKGFWLEILQTPSGFLCGSREQAPEWRRKYGVTADPPSAHADLATDGKIALPIDPTANPAMFKSAKTLLGLDDSDLAPNGANV